MNPAHQQLYMFLRHDAARASRVGAALHRWLTADHVGAVMGAAAEVFHPGVVGGVTLHEIQPRQQYAVWVDRGAGWRPEGAFYGNVLRTRWSDLVGHTDFHPVTVLPEGESPETAIVPPSGATAEDRALHAWRLPDGTLWWPSAEAARIDMATLREREARQVRDLANISPDFGFQREPKKRLASTRALIREAQGWGRAVYTPAVGMRVREGKLTGTIVEVRPDEFLVKFQHVPFGLENYADPGVWRRSFAGMKVLA